MNIRRAVAGALAGAALLVGPVAAAQADTSTPAAGEVSAAATWHYSDWYFASETCELARVQFTRAGIPSQCRPNWPVFELW